MDSYTNALQMGWRVFPLYGIKPDGTCESGDPHSPAGKRPRAPNWQHTPVWDADQLAYLEDDDGLFFGNQLEGHYGIVVDTSGLLVVDIDGRNGGYDSAASLQHIRDACGYIVQTGGGGEHWYFRRPPECPKLASKLRDYPGIDWKVNGFVVGAGSRHASGIDYEAIRGSPETVTYAPQALIDLLAMSDYTAHGDAPMIEAGELGEVLRHIANPDHDYNRWLQVGMGLHDATGGEQAGLDAWLAWTIGTGRNDIDTMAYRWHGFGKADNPITAGSLLKWAAEGGYIAPVTFIDDTEWAPVEEEPKPYHGGRHDLLDPPGLVGEITRWINARCTYPRPHLAVAAALHIVSNAAGMNYLVAGTETSLNLFSVGIADSRTGKGAIKRCIDEVNTALGLGRASYGKFKSAQELARNALEHQIIVYVYDEFGKQLQKLANSGRSGAHYLEDLLPEMIAMYSEATGRVGISGDVAREMREAARKTVAREAKDAGLSEGENVREVAKREPNGKLARALQSLERAEQGGIVEPYLSFIGFTEPRSFQAAVDADPWLLTGGLLGRALIFEETDNLPEGRPFEDVNHAHLPTPVMGKLRALFDADHYENDKHARIERRGDWKRIGFAPEARAMLAQVSRYWADVARAEDDDGSGLQSQAKGATEIAIKVAGILSAADGVISRENMEWAHALVKSITMDKIARAGAGEKLASKSPEEKGAGLLDAAMRLVHSLPPDGYTTAGKLRQSAGRTKVSLADAARALAHLAKAGKITERAVEVKGRRCLQYLVDSTMKP